MARKVLSHLSMHIISKCISWAKAMLNGEKIKPVAIAITGLKASGMLLVSQ